MQSSLRIVCSFLLALAACSAAQPPVILISIDTLRADHLSCYGSGGRPTSNIDALTKGGTLFAQADAQAPLTLPSHVSMLTSTYPFANGIRDNGQKLSGKEITLAQVLRARGYRTGAFVGGFVLDRQFGLDRGFDTYDSPFRPPADREADSADLKRLGEDVVDSASRWVEKNAGSPFFLFLHLFDLHTPDNLPPAMRARFSGPRYQAELGYVDMVLGNFFDFLKKRGLYENALIVFTSDHGESLGDHGENSHGYFIYQSTLHVPLIIRWPAGMGPYPERWEDAVSLMTIAPTIVEAAGAARPPQFQGKSLIGQLVRKGPRTLEEIYSESLYAWNHFGTSSLSSLRKGRYKYIDAPKPEFYDLAEDPAEKSNLYPARRSLVQGYQQRLSSLKPKAQAKRDGPSAEVTARLRSLGYLAGSAPSLPPESGPDPKDRIGDYENYRRAIALATAGRMPESNRVLEGLLAKHADLDQVRMTLGLNRQKLGLHEQAAQSFREILAKDAANVTAHFYLANSYLELKRTDDAIRELEATLASASDQRRGWDQVAIPAEEILARLRIEKKEYSRAKTHYSHLLSIDAGNYEAHYNLAWLAAMDKRLDEGVRHLLEAVKTKPNDAAARNALGGLYLRLGSLEKAKSELDQAVRLDSKSPWAHYNLGLVLRQQGDTAGAARQFQRALDVAPQFGPAREALSRTTQ
ncbi:MAG: sulfatase-like hydrolase/transferase [Bryobacteraceae bacterium]